MTTTKKIPALRFPEFEGEWPTKLLGDIATFSKGKGVSKSDIDENGKYECIRYGELYTHYNELIKYVISRTNVDEKELVFSEYNDVIIPGSGETQLDIATASCVLKDGVALGGDLNIIKTKINGVFLAYYLNNAKKNNIATLAQGNSVVHLYSSQLKTLSLNLPVKEEQQKIANFLTALDDKIQELTKKKALSEQYKKGVMQQIFNQQIRFKDDDGNDYPDWEEKKLSEVCFKKASNVSANALEENNGIYKIYGAAGVLKKVDFYKEEEEYISIVKDGAGAGRVFLCESKSSVLGTLDIIKNNSMINIYYLFIILEKIEFNKYITGSTIPHIYFKDYSMEIIPLPRLHEQQKIADFLTSIDNKINAVNKQLGQTQEYKKALLQQMFV